MSPRSASSSRPSRTDSAPRPRRRIVIIGGGLSGLVTAYELSRTPELRARFEVDLYQLGHRLGGKLASGRNLAQSGRSEEHGLHVWFGFYANTFALVREIYERWSAPEDCPLRGLEDVATPVHRGFLGDPGPGRWSFRPVDHIPNAAEPGSPSLSTGAADWILGLGAWVRRFMNLGLPAGSRRSGLARRLIALARLLERRIIDLARRWQSLRDQERLDWARKIDRRLATLQRWAVQPLVRRGVERGLVELARRVDFATAVCRGLLDPEDGIMLDGDLDRINDRDFRQWLLEHGCSLDTVRHWSWIEGLYDASFQYIAGERHRPSFEAGTALRFALRALLTYQGAFVYLINAGMGEALIAPLYEVLRSQGVRFHFFHRLDDLDLDADAHRVRRLHLARQAKLERDRYEPLVTIEGLRCWTVEPDWSQLEDGEALAAAGVDFESRRPSPVETPVTLELGDDFDQVVLALPLGAIAPDRQGRTPCRAWLDAHPQVARAVESINLVPSVAAQLWLDEDHRGLGWSSRPAVLRSPSWFSIWCDMTPVIDHEGWKRPRPRSTLYFCGAAPLRSHLQPGEDLRTKARELARARTELSGLLEEHGSDLLGSVTAGGFDWSVLHDPEGRDGPARLNAQYVRINVEPSDLCDVAAVGTSFHRLEPHQSGLENLVLAGTWIRTSINSTCVEAAAMSGMAAARALGVTDRPVIGESFFCRAPSRAALPDKRYRPDPMPLPSVRERPCHNVSFDRLPPNHV